MGRARPWYTGNKHAKIIESGILTLRLPVPIVVVLVVASVLDRS